MATRIVTISHATGAGGDGIGRSVADRLHFRYVDEEIIEVAAKKHGLDASVVADAERRKNLLARILDDLGSAPLLDPSGTAGFVMAETAAPPRTAKGSCAAASWTGIAVAKLNSAAAPIVRIMCVSLRLMKAHPYGTT